MNLNMIVLCFCQVILFSVSFFFFFFFLSIDILKVGMIQEILGNGIEAESLLSWGKTIALHQCLPFYVICFSNLLGIVIIT